MGRHEKFNRESIAAAALALVAEDGPRAATIGAIANRLGAPTGSIYHRYESRELLLAELWMSVVEGYQNGFVEALEGEDTLAAAVRAARYMPGWVRAHLSEARLLLLHRREDFVGGPWPGPLVERAERLMPQMAEALKRFCRRHLRSTAGPALLRARFALLDVPFGAVKPHVQAARVPPPLVDDLIEETVRAVLGPR